jgi:hypothetical protein
MLKFGICVHANDHNGEWPDTTHGFKNEVKAVKAVKAVKGLAVKGSEPFYGFCGWSATPIGSPSFCDKGL